jgi:hypothetical protein
MKHRFLVHNLNHTVLLWTLGPLEIPSENDLPEGKPQTVPSLRFRSWALAEKYLTERGAGKITL